MWAISFLAIYGVYIYSGARPFAVPSIQSRHLESNNDVPYNITMFKVVIDTDVMVAAFESATGASRQLVFEVLEGGATLLLSTGLMLEYEDVLTRPETLSRSGLSVSEVIAVLDELAEICSPVGFDFRWRPLAADADDDVVLETAINGGADVIATFNAKDMIAGAGAFGIPVARPAEVLKRIRA